MINTFSAFSTPIGIQENFLTEEQCRKIVERIKRTDSEHQSILGNGTSSFNDTDNAISMIDSLHIVPNIRAMIWDSIISFSNDSGIACPNNITNSWVNFQQEGSTLLMHTHPFSAISGALYLNVDRDSSPIYFRNPNQIVNFQVADKSTEYTRPDYFLEPSVGSLVLFPSWLEHGCEQVKNATQDRAVLSFNTDYGSVPGVAPSALAL